MDPNALQLTRAGTLAAHYAGERPMLAAVDLGGTNTDVLLARPDGEIVGRATLPWATVADTADLAGVLLAAGADPEAVTAVAVTGGRHRSLPENFGPTRIVKVEELIAISRGALAAAGRQHGLIMSLGTGTAMIAATPEGLRHMGGMAVGGGTILGLARLLLGTTDHTALGALAAAGDPRAVDLSVGDIVGGPVGMIPAEMAAAHFGRVARPDAPPPRPEDVAAGLMELVGQTLGRLGLMAARTAGMDTVILTGHLIEWPGIRAAVGRMSRAFGGDVIIPPDPGFATALGALSVLVQR